MGSKKPLFYMLITTQDREEKNAMLLKAAEEKGVNNVIVGYYTPLQYAVKVSDHDLVKSVLELGADINAVNYQGNTALHFVSSTSMVKLLLEHNADINKKNSLGETPLHIVAYLADEKLVAILLENGASVATDANDGRFPLHYLFKLRGDNNNKIPYFDDLSTRIRIAQELIYYGARVYAKDKRGLYALFNLTHNEIYGYEIRQFTKKLSYDGLGDSSLYRDQ